MSLHHLISSSVPSLTQEDTIEQSLSILEETKLLQLPIVNDDNYMALVQENELMDASDSHLLLKDSGLLHNTSSIDIDKHPYEALHNIFEMKLSVLPVIDQDKKYAGSITKDTLLNYFYENSLLHVPGGIIVLEISGRNYSLCEIARICENEDVNILNVQTRISGSDSLEVTLKTNKSIIDGLVSSFDRYNYVVKEVYSEMINKDDLLNKYNILMKYINM